MSGSAIKNAFDKAKKLFAVIRAKINAKEGERALAHLEYFNGMQFVRMQNGWFDFAKPNSRVNFLIHNDDMYESMIALQNDRRIFAKLWEAGHNTIRIPSTLHFNGRYGSRTLKLQHVMEICDQAIETMEDAIERQMPTFERLNFYRPPGSTLVPRR